MTTMALSKGETMARKMQIHGDDLVEMPTYVRQELRQCLRTIDLYAQLLERPDEARGAVGEAEAIGYIREAVERLEELMRADGPGP